MQGPRASQEGFPSLRGRVPRVSLEGLEHQGSCSGPQEALFEVALGPARRGSRAGVPASLSQQAGPQANVLPETLKGTSV